MRYLRPFALCLLVALVATGCDSTGDDDDEDLPGIAGTWTATTLTLAFQGESYDVLEEGGELRMTLNEDGTVDDGLLSAPCSIPGVCDEGEEGNFEADFEGTYEQDGQTVTFDHETSTFIRDVEWIYDGTTLSTSTVALTVMLTR